MEKKDTTKTEVKDIDLKKNKSLVKIIKELVETDYDLRKAIKNIR